MQPDDGMTPEDRVLRQVELKRMWDEIGPVVHAAYRAYRAALEAWMNGAGTEWEYCEKKARHDELVAQMRAIEEENARIARPEPPG